LDLRSILRGKGPIESICMRSISLFDLPGYNILPVCVVWVGV
jgi:hypothetical protein